jgi:hypothetical protein
MPRYKKDKNLIPTGSLVEIKYEDLEKSFEVLAFIQNGSISPTSEGLPSKLSRAIFWRGVGYASK